MPSIGRPYLRLRILTFLSLALGVLVAVPTLLVTALGFGTALSNTGRLLDERSELFRNAMVARLDAFLSPAQSAAGFIARRLEGNGLDRQDQDAVAVALSYALAAAPQLSALSYASDAGWLVVAFRRPGGEVGIDRRAWRGDPAIGSAVADAQANGAGALWERPVYVPDAGMTVVTLADPVRAAGDHVGTVIASVRLDDLSRFIEELAGPARQRLGAQLFVLYDRQYVIAHPSLISPGGLLSSLRPVPLIGEVGDPVLAEIWRPDGREPLRFTAGPGHALTVDGREYAFFYEPLRLTSEAPWLVGGYVPNADATPELVRLLLASVVAAAALLAAVTVAVWTARRLGRPAVELAHASELVARLELDAVPALPRSHLAEIDAAARAFNGMVGALRIFVRYAPARVVRALICQGEAAVRSERRVVTLMFTDMSGFTATAEQMSAEAVASLLNAHHTLVIGCVEAEGGTVDKLIGDGLLAFWNAPEPQPDHADRALRAALAIRAALREANREATHPVRLRVGLHTGPAVVGHVGSPRRLSYTIVGDTVNVGSRIEQQNRELQPDAEVAILLSDATARALNAPPPLRALGRHRMRGREGEVELFTVAD